MTNKETIEALKKLKLNGSLTDNDRQAINNAIKALQKEE